jgi:hypothetical protein
MTKQAHFEAADHQELSRSRNGRAVRPSPPSQAGASCAPKDRKVGLLVAGSIKTLSLDKNSFETALTNAMYQPRVAANTLSDLDLHTYLESNLVASIPHCSSSCSRRPSGTRIWRWGSTRRRSTNTSRAPVSVPQRQDSKSHSCWLHMADAYKALGRRAVRQNKPADAKVHYERIIRTDLDRASLLASVSSSGDDVDAVGRCGSRQRA